MLSFLSSSLNFCINSRHHLSFHSFVDSYSMTGIYFLFGLHQLYRWRLFPIKPFEVFLNNCQFSTWIRYHMIWYISERYEYSFTDWFRIYATQRNSGVITSKVCKDFPRESANTFAATLDWSLADVHSSLCVRSNVKEMWMMSSVSHSMMKPKSEVRRLIWKFKKRDTFDTGIYSISDSYSL